MTIPGKFSYDIRFVGGDYEPWPPDSVPLKDKFCRLHEGKPGWADINVGDRNKKLGQLGFFFGPLISAFVQLTGIADKEYWHWQLKNWFRETYFVVRTEEGKEYERGIRNLSEEEMRGFLKDCVNRLMDEGGHLEEFEGREWQEIRGEKVD